MLKLTHMSEPSVIYEDKNFLAVNKPAGYLTHHVGQGKGANAPALTDWLLKRYPEIKKVGDEPVLRPGIVHRLDKDTSGVILVARNQKYFEYLKSLFQSRAVKKTYLALVWGEPKEKSGRIEAPIGLKSGTIRREVGGKKMLKLAVTEFKLKSVYENEAGETFSLLEVRPLTGRTHQIRVHLRHVGHPIVGDPIYGRRKEKEKQLMLHAASLEFEIEPGRRIKLEAELPENFEKTLETLKTRD